MQLTDKQQELLRDVILSDFNQEELVRTLLFRFDHNLSARINLSNPLHVVVFDLIQLAEREGRLVQLIEAVYQENPSNPHVQHLVEMLGWTAVQVPNEIRQSIPYFDVEHWRTKLSELEGQVCRVEIGRDGALKGGGTGFLVGPDVLLTCYHVLDEVVRNREDPRNVRLRFDYKQSSEGAVLRPGTVFHLHSDWLIDASPWGPGENDLSKSEAPERDQLDYILVRVADDPGLRPSNAAESTSQIRGWIRIPSPPPVPTPGMSLFILQHPRARPLKLAFSLNGVVELNAKRSRFHHRVPTEPGSGGSPCFNADWNLVGIHQGTVSGRYRSGAPKEIPPDPAETKKAIPIEAIVELLRARGFQGAGDRMFAKVAAPTPETPGRVALHQKLRSFRPRLEVNGETAPAPPSGYLAAAAVLVAFNPARLKPLPPAAVDDTAVAQLLAKCTLQTRPGQEPRWCLNPDVRRGTLRQLGRDGIRRALELNRSFPEEPLQRIFSAYILGALPPLPGRDVQRLRDLLQVVEWLDGVVAELPDADLVRQRIAREELLEPFRRLAGPDFSGRHYELFRLNAYLTSEAQAPLLIHGPGGVGKSALLGRFLLDRHGGIGPWVPFVYIDFDRPGFAAEEPVSLLLEAVRQLGAQFPEQRDPAAELLRKWSARLNATSSGQPRPPGRKRAAAFGPSLDREEFRREFIAFTRKLLLPGDPLLWALDTFEEVQYRSRDFVEALWQFLAGLRAEIPGLRVVVSGRAPLPGLEMETLPLGDLDAEAAQEFLRHRGVSRGDAETVVSQLGGNPLSLKLAALVLAHEGPGGADLGTMFTDPSLALKVRNQLVQGKLYERILGHIHDEEVRKLAYPGLVLRRIDPDLIREVLAGPCGLDVPDLNKAHELFRKLFDEVALVQVGEDSALYHRADVRRVMLGLLRQEARAQVRAIHERAVDFYRRKNEGRGQTDLVARAEEIYHRLSLGEPTAEVDRLWVPGLERYLLSAVEEFPATVQTTYLASRLGMDLPPDVWKQADLEDWERHVAERARDLLRLGQPDKALAAIRERAERTEASPLYQLESQALLRLPQPDLEQAARVAAAGVASASAAGDYCRVQGLLLHLAEVERLRGRPQAGRDHMTQARAIARKQDDLLTQIEATAGYLRLGRDAGVAADVDAPDRKELVELLGRLPDSALASNPTLARRAIAEVFQEAPQELVRVVRLVSLTEENARLIKEFAGALEEWGMTTRYLQEIAPIMLSTFADDPEAVSQKIAFEILVASGPDGLAQARKLIDELVQTKPLPAGDAFGKWLRRVVEENPPTPTSELEPKRNPPP